MGISAQDDDGGPYSTIIGRFIGVCGVGAALALLCVSAAMNWRFGYSLGKTPLDGIIYGTASAAADCLKAVVPFFFFGAIRRKAWSRAIAAAIVGVVVTGYSLFSAFGHAAQNRSETTGHRAVDGKIYQALSADLKRAQDQFSWVPPHRPTAMVSGEIDGLKIQRHWLLTQECVSINSKAAREFCTKYHELNAELGTGRQADELAARIADIQRKLERFQGTSAEQAADPQAAFLGELLGLNVQQVQLALTVFVAVLLEVGSGLGLYMALGQWRAARGSGNVPDLSSAEHLVAESPLASLPPPKAIPATSAQTMDEDEEVRRFCHDRIKPSQGRTCSVTATYDAYQQWCDEEMVEALSLPVFVRVLGERGIRRLRSGDGLVFVDVEITGRNQLRPREDTLG